MKQLSLNNLGVQELDAREMVEVDGGKGWGDLIWMYAEDIIKTYGKLCKATIEAYMDGTIDNVGSKR
ncbi:MAG: hypothetical protein RBT19_05830 [Tenuifilaceae bacterium]|jgi:hypothetical protein|nr:hypothetical protein [Tenuifilaceae bacterium]